MSRMSQKIAGICGGAFLAATPMMAIAQDDNSQISDRWRFVPTTPTQPSLLNPRPIQGSNYEMPVPPVIVLQKDFRLSSDEKFTVHIEAQKNGDNSLQDIIKSGTLPFAGSNDGGGKMGLKFKKGILLSYKREF